MLKLEYALTCKQKNLHKQLWSVAEMMCTIFVAKNENITVMDIDWCVGWGIFRQWHLTLQFKDGKDLLIHELKSDPGFTSC